MVNVPAYRKAIYFESVLNMFYNYTTKTYINTKYNYQSEHNLHTPADTARNRRS